MKALRWGGGGPVGLVLGKDISAHVVQRRLNRMKVIKRLSSTIRQRHRQIEKELRSPTQKIISLMILPAPGNLNTLQTIIHSTLPQLQLQPHIRTVRENQRIARVFLDGLRVEVLGGREVAGAEGRVAFFFELVGEVGHLDLVFL